MVKPTESPQPDPMQLAQVIALPPGLSVAIIGTMVQIAETLTEHPVVRVGYQTGAPLAAVLGSDWKTREELVLLMGAMSYAANLIRLNPERCPSSLVVARQRDDGQFDLWEVKAV